MDTFTSYCILVLFHLSLADDSSCSCALISTTRRSRNQRRASRDPATMTSSEPERGDSAAECQQAETPPSVDSDNDNVVVQTVTGVEGQTYTQAAATSADGTSSPGADRKQNSDEPEASSAGSSGTPWFSL